MTLKKLKNDKDIVNVDEREIRETLRKQTKRNYSEHPLYVSLDELLRGMEDANSAAFLSISMVGKHHFKKIDELKADVAKYDWKDTEDAGKQSVMVEGAHAASELSEKVRKLERLQKSRVIQTLEKSLYTGIFSEYDVFIGNLLRAIYTTNPILFKGIKREILLNDLLEFDSVDAVKRDILDKEIDSFRRDSYVDQFCVLEKKFELPLRKFNEWPKFVEFGQRRNLMTHNGGICSDQYLIVCEREGYKFDKRPEVGDQLRIGKEYFTQATSILSKVAYMLTHTLWRKVLPAEKDMANEALNSVVFDLLVRKEWALAAEFGQFGLTDIMRKGITDLDHRLLVINTAIGLKYSDENDKAINLIDSLDWSASIRDFKLACAVLKERYTMAANLMIEIGKSGELINQLAYHDWPLFNKFRDVHECHETYEKIYGIPFLRVINEPEVSKYLSEIALASHNKKTKLNKPAAASIKKAMNPIKKERTPKKKNIQGN